MNKVNIWEEDVVIPTYEVGEPDKNPMFLEKRVYQGSSGKVYPYPTTEVISHEKKDKTYRAVYLENKYLKVMVLPELGGRIQRAYDKTNDYDFVYYNHVIKPALVGLIGPWISGGIEFNWPQHHRPTTYMPTDHLIRTNDDGSMTLLVNDVDQMYGTKAICGFTLYPDKAYIEISGQLYNRTSLPQTFLWWANPAVEVNDYTQSIFPPDIHSVYDHGKRDVSRFPIATGTYYKHDYSEGVDISRYKNIPVPTSYMAESSAYNFIGGYDYSKSAGILHVADHHISPGKKQWTWGNGEFGQAWDRSLTDEDGPYIELMTGVYTDNQPDFTWLKPFEEKTFKQYFMPYKAVGEVKNATIDAVVNIEVNAEKIYVCAYATAVYENTKIVIYHKGNEIVCENTLLSPENIFESEYRNDGYNSLDIKIEVICDGKIRVEYQEEDQGIPELAQPAKAAREPKEILTNDELYLTGQHIEQYRHATYLPDPYYLEGLKRDPKDSRINNAYGVLLLRRALFSDSQKYFETAIERLTYLNPNPYNSEAYYNLGLAYFYQELYDKAYDAFFKATWTNEQQEMSFYYLAAIDVRKKDFNHALEMIDKALVKNAHNIKARGLKAIILRMLKKTKEYEIFLQESLTIDEFDYLSSFEQVLSGLSNEKHFENLTRGFHESYLNVARDYAECGHYKEAIEVLNRNQSKKPLIHYYKAFYYSKLGEYNEAKAEVKIADQCNPKYTFPNKLEDVAVLEHAISCFPEGSKAYYYLGNLQYDKLQFESGIKNWEKSVELDNNFATVLRNLGIAYYNKLHNPKKAQAVLERAFELDKTDARVFLELDQLHKKIGFSYQERLENYEHNKSIIELRDDVYTEYVVILNMLQRYQEAYEAIKNHVFRPWEGAEGKITTQYKIALLELAKIELRNKEYNEAKNLIEKALIYPENLGEGRLEGSKENNLYYNLALAYEGLGNKEKANENYLKASSGHDEPAGMMYYYDQPADLILYQGLALQKLGNQKEANARFYKLLDYGEKHLRDDIKIDYFAVSIPDFVIFDENLNDKNKAHCYYLMALAYMGLGKNEEAVHLFDQSLSYDPHHQNSIVYKNDLKQ